MYNQEANRSIVLRNTLYFFIPPALLVLALATFLYRSELNKNQTIVEHTSQNGIETVATLIDNNLELIQADLLLLANEKEVFRYMNTKREEYLPAAQEILKRHSAFRPYYDQVRLLGEDGKELIRVNHGPTGAVLVSESELQDKSQRYYFQNSIGLKEAEIYVSPFDLNIEQNKIETPWKPMIRFATPVISRTGESLGVIVLNFLGDTLLSNLQNYSGKEGVEPMLLNQKGYWLCGGDSLDWAFMFGESNESRFSQHYPSAWKTINQEENGIFYVEDNLFVFRRIPILSGSQSETMTHGAYSVSPQERYWTVVFHVPQSEFAEYNNKLMATTSSIATVLLLLFGISSWRVALVQQKHRFEVQRNERQRLLVSVLNRAPFGVILSHQEGVVEFLNEHLVELFQLRSESIPKHLDQLLSIIYPPGSTIESVRTKWFEAIQTAKRGGFFSFVTTVLPAAANEMELEVRASPLDEALVIIVVRDITEEIRLQKQLIQSQKMEAVGRLAAGVAHDFNNHLTVILCNSEMMQASFGKDETADMLLGEVIDTTNRAATLVRQLLLFTRNQNLPPEKIELHDLVNNIEKMLRRVVGQGVQLVKRDHSKKSYLFAVPSHIEQIILNLVVNSRDAMQDRGIIEISIDQQVVEDLHCHMTGAPFSGTYTTLAVKDDGSGIKPENMDNLFDAFYTTKEKGKGTGLGLATVSQIVQQLGGHIHIDTVLGQGTTFTVYFPNHIPLEASEHEGQRLTLHQQELHKDVFVLLIDDDDAVRRAVNHTLIEFGYQVMTARSGYEAIGMIEHTEEPFQIAVIDLVLPRMRGPEVLEQLLEIYKHELKVLFISGYSGEGIAEEEMVARGHAFLAKPFTPTQLAQKLHELLAP